MEAPAQTRKLRFGAFEADLRSGELRKHGIRLKLQDQPFQLLAFMLQRPGDLVTRDELRQRLWPADTFVDFDTGLNSAIKKLRDVLGDSADEPRYIETIPKRGYRFIAPLVTAAEPPLLPDPVPDTPVRETVLPASASSGVPAPQRFRLAPWRLLFGATVVLLLFGGFLLFRGSRAKGTRQPAIKSIAVLPLKNLSGDSAQDYLADGMTEALIGRLAGIHDLRVISRTSVTRFKDTRLSVPEIARTLGVDAIVEGSVIRDAGRIRVHAQLIRAATDDHLWAESYDREMRDVLGLQSDVAQSIARKVEVTITGQEHALLAAARPVAPEVYESYLKGNFANRNTTAGIQQSIAFFAEAIKKDATFAPAYVGLAGAYEDLGSVFGGVPPSETRPKVISAAQKALDLDPELAEAHVLLADTYQREWQWKESEAEFRRALELKPNDATGHRGFAAWLLCQGRLEEAVAWSRRARELDPLGVDGIVANGLLLFHARHYDQSIQELRSVLAVQPDHAMAHWFLGYDLIATGQPDQAVPELEKALVLSDRSAAVIGVLARAYAHAGRQAEALRLVAELKRRKQSRYVPAAAFVNAYLGLGDNEQALFWLERCYQEKSSILQFLRVHPYFDPIRGDPRFKDLLRRVDLN
jgi:TolB-like protein/DNA-binding winged helix-turn-helix (wHTH) protein/tetratricopeptide (TPR) repeat protein